MTNRPTTTKAFDCLEYKRAVQRRIFDEIKNLSVDEQIEYFRRRAETGSLGKWWQTVIDGTKENR